MDEIHNSIERPGSVRPSDEHLVPIELEHVALRPRFRSGERLGEQASAGQASDLSVGSRIACNDPELPQVLGIRLGQALDSSGQLTQGELVDCRGPLRPNDANRTERRRCLANAWHTAKYQRHGSSERSAN
jgi:hypothetical protein